jgi:hypothetical protein
LRKNESIQPIVYQIGAALSHLDIGVASQIELGLTFFARQLAAESGLEDERADSRAEVQEGGRGERADTRAKALNEGRGDAERDRGDEQPGVGNERLDRGDDEAAEPRVTL